MGINRTSFSAQDITQNYNVAIKMVSTKPDTTEYMDTAVEPNVMVGFYNDTTNSVELYVADASGHRYIKVV